MIDNNGNRGSYCGKVATSAIPFSSDPYENLFYAIVYKAAMDLEIPRYRKECIRFLDSFALGEKILDMKGVSEFERDFANYGIKERTKKPNKNRKYKT